MQQNVISFVSDDCHRDQHVARPWRRVAFAAVIVAIVYSPILRHAFADPPLGSAALRDARARLVETAIVGGGIKNERVVRAIGTVPRHNFVAKKQQADAYIDTSLPIGHGQTISSPYVVAYMTEQLDPQPADRVLEIGTGSGYQAAVLSELVSEVFTIEIVEPLGRSAARTIKQLGYDNIQMRIGDGFAGWKEHAPFDKIIVTCSPEKVPQPLVEQLKEGGRLVVPVGQRFQQMLYLFTKVDGKLKQEALQTTYFVPMTGEAEELRVVRTDSAKPSIANGSFEELLGDGELPSTWYYVRQAKVEQSDHSPEGRHELTFANVEAGKPSKAVQAIGVDGKVVHSLEFSFQARGDVPRSASSRNQELPGVFVEFYDKNRIRIHADGMELWPSSESWREHKFQVKVPPAAMLGVIRIGLGQAVGELSLDDLQVHAIDKR